MQASNEQKRVINSLANRLLVLAGPGSGKTTTLVERMSIVGSRPDIWPPRKVVCITFTQEAGRMLRQKLEARGIEVGFAGTLHAYALHCLRRAGQDPVILSDRTATLALKSAMTATRCKSSFKHMRLVISQQEKATAKDAPAVARYLSDLEEAGALDYDMLLISFLEMLRGSSEVPVHLFVDEFQDSAPIDAAIYEAMPKLSMTIIGDPDQAIYAFRGATRQNLLDVMSAPGWETCHLADNYRCPTRIVDAADRLISRNYASPPPKHRAMREGGEITFRVFGTPESEAQAIVTAVQRGGGTWGIFTRYNAHREAITAAFIAAGMLAPEVQQGREVATLLALVQFWANPTSRLLQTAYLETLHGPDEAMRIVSTAQKQGRPPIAPALMTPPTDLQTLIQGLLTARLSRAAVGAARAAAGKLASFDLRALSLALREAGDETEGAGFLVTTFHGSKGLEFDNVWIAAAEDQLTPAAKKGEALEEERRLFYVAMTRARDHVVMSRVDSRPDSWAPGRVTSPKWSRFVEETR